MDKKDVWSTDDIIRNRNNWNLAGDAELLKHLQSLSEKLIDKSHATLNLLNSFENDVNRTCTSVANINNRFRALSDTQFIENKVRDESPETEKCDTTPVEIEKPANEDITVKLKEALGNGIKVLRSHYDIIPVTDSDSDDDEPPEVLLKARNPYMGRRLPYIIGTEDFTKYDHLGLVTSSEDEEEEEEFEESEKSDTETVDVETEIPKPQPVKTDRIEVIRIPSSDSEDISSAEDEPREPPNISANVHPEINSVQAPYSFADHLNATLRNVSGTVPPLVDDIFSPPPFPTKDNDYFSDEEKSNSSDDMFAPSKRPVKQPVIDRNFVIPDPAADDDINDDDSYSKEPPANIFQNKAPHLVSHNSSTVSDASQSDSSSTPKSDSLFEKIQPQLPPKYSNLPQKNAFSAVNAELSAKLKVNTKPKDEQSSSDETDSKVSTTKNDVPTRDSKSRHSKNRGNPILDNVLNETLKTEVAAAHKNKQNGVVAQKSNESTKSEVPLPTPSDDITQSLPATAGKASVKDTQTSSAPSAGTKKSITKSKIAGLFDDDDTIDDLFKPSAKPAKTVPAASKEIKSEILFDDDLPPLSNTRAQKSVEKKISKPAASSTNLLSKKLDLFDDDSDSGDDIFAIINSQKKVVAAPSTNSVSNAAKTMKGSLFTSTDDDLFSSLSKPETVIGKSSKPKSSEPPVQNDFFGDDTPKLTQTPASSAGTDHVQNDLFEHNTPKSAQASDNSIGTDLFINSDAKTSGILKENIPKKSLSSSNEKDSVKSKASLPEEVDLFGSMKSSSQSKSAVLSGVGLFSSDNATFSKPVGSSPRPVPKKLDLFASDEEDSNALDKKNMLGGSSKSSAKNADLFKSDDEGSSALDSESVLETPKNVSSKTSKSADISKNCSLFDSGDDDLGLPTSKPVQQTAEIDLFGDSKSSLFPKADVPCESIPPTEDLFASAEASESMVESTKPRSQPPAVAPRTLLKSKPGSANPTDGPPVIPRNLTVESNLGNDGVSTDTKNESSEPRVQNVGDAGEKIMKAERNVAARVETSVVKEVQTSSQEEDNAREGHSIDEDLFKGMKLGVNPPDSSTKNPGVAAIINRMQAGDEGDGNLLGKNTTESSSTSISPGKLTAQKSLNINVNALLPGSNWSAISKLQKQMTEEVTSEQMPAQSSNSVEVIPSSEPPQQPSNVLNSVIKERAKVSARRRPPSRRARISNLQRNDLFAVSTANSSDDDPDSAYKTASESNSPDNKATKVSSFAKPADESPKAVGVNAGKPAGEDDYASGGSQPPDSLAESKGLVTRSETSGRDVETVEPTATSQPTLPTFTKNRAKIPNRRPPSVLKKTVKKDEPTALPPDKSAKPAHETVPPASENETQTSSHFDTDLFSASSTREPPVMTESDFKTLFDESDEDDDLFNDAVFKGKTRLPGDVDSSDIASFPADVEAATRNMINSRFPPDLPSVSVPGTENTKPVKNVTVDKLASTDLFSSVGNDVDDLSAKLIASNKILVKPTADGSSKSIAGAAAVESKPVSKATKLVSENDSLQEVSTKSVTNKPVTKPASVKGKSDLFDSSDEAETDDIFPEMKIKSEISKPVTEAAPVKGKSDLFSSLNEVETDDLFPKMPIKSEASKPVTEPASVKGKSGLFSSVTEVVTDDLFSKMQVKSEASKPVTKPASVEEKSDLFSSMDEGQTDDLFPKMKTGASKLSTKPISVAKAPAAKDLVSIPGQKGPSVEPKTASTSKPSINIFEDDGDLLFSSTKSSLTKKTSDSKRFLFDDNDDDDLFGKKPSSRSDKLVEPTHKPKPVATSEKARVVKLRSEVVERDPLTGEIIKK